MHGHFSNIYVTQPMFLSLFCDRWGRVLAGSDARLIHYTRWLGASHRPVTPSQSRSCLTGARLDPLAKKGSACYPLSDKAPPTFSRKVERNMRNSKVASPPLPLSRQLEAEQTRPCPGWLCGSLIRRVSCRCPPYFRWV